MPVQSLAEFILYITPGFIAIQIYRWRYPAKDHDSFIEIAYSVVSGLILISLLNWIDKNWLNFSLNSNISGMPSARYSLGIIVIGVCGGFLAIAWIEVRSCLSKKISWLKWISPGVDSIWQVINDATVTDWAVVYLQDGVIYRGWIKRYSYNPEVETHDFLLGRASRVDENLRVIYEVDGIGVYLNTRDVKRIEYIKGTEKAIENDNLKTQNNKLVKKTTQSKN